MRVSTNGEVLSIFQRRKVGDVKETWSMDALHTSRGEILGGEQKRGGWKRERFTRLLRDLLLASFMLLSKGRDQRENHSPGGTHVRGQFI